ncbi:hypothetical protein M9458_031742, partial [Cirrhinus mrigala]
TSSVIFFNIQNTLRNMRLLAKGLLCNLEEKLLDINTEPLGNYIKMLKLQDSPQRGRTGFKPDRAKRVSIDQRFVVNREDI